MPLIKLGYDKLPDWSELDKIKIYRLNKDEIIEYNVSSDREKLFVGTGECRIYLDDAGFRMKSFDTMSDIYKGDAISINALDDNTTVIRVGGSWGEETGNSGVFTLENSDNFDNKGDPVDYEKKTSLDNHYHDCDEYWIIFKGRALTVSEGEFYKVEPDDCIATKTGEHHDIPEVYEKLHGVYFETTLKGKKRGGHLWDHTNS